MAREEQGIVRGILEIIEEAAPGLYARTLRAIERAIRVRFGGDEHYVATAASLVREDLHQAIRRAVLDDGLTPPAAAERFGVSRQTAWRVSRR